MKILQITFNLCPGGAERFVVDLSNELVKRHEVTLMTLMDDTIEPEISQFYKYDLDSKVQYKNLGIRKGNGFSLKILYRVYQAMKNEGADVIHLHVHGVVNFCILGIIMLCNKTKIVQTIHTDFNIGHSSAVYNFLFKTLGRAHKMRWAALSQSNYNDMMSSYPYIIGQRIDNGRASMRPTEFFQQTRNEIAGYKTTTSTKVFLHIARCVKVKNQHMLVAAFNCIVKEKNDVVLLIIGDGFDSEEGLKIQREAGEKIHFLGTRKNVSDYMLNVDCFCLSSLYEGLPISILEALLSGVPVISTPIKGAIDVLCEGVTGIISKDFSEKEYVNALKKGIQNLDFLRTNTLAKKDDCPYTIRKCAAKYEKFYQI